MPLDELFCTLYLWFSHLVFEGWKKFDCFGLVIIIVPDLPLIAGWSVFIHKVQHKIRYFFNVNTMLLAFSAYILYCVYVHF